MNIYQTQAEGKVLAAIEPSLSEMGFEVVRVKIMRGRGDVLQIMIDRADGAAITITDCEKASWQISAIMDVEDPIEDKYVLEVSSAGMDRPLTRVKDFCNNIGESIKLVSYHAINGRKRFAGVMIYADEHCLHLKVVEHDLPVQIELQNIQEASVIAAFPEGIKLNRKSKR